MLGKDKDVMAVLGGPKHLGVARVTRLSLADAVVRGFPPDTLERIKAALGLSDLEVAEAVGLSPKTLSRRRKEPDKPLGAVESDRIYRLAAVYALAKDVLEDPDAARAWLRTPKVGLGGRVPLDLLQTEAGTREVQDLLGRIEYGVLS